MMTTSSVPIAIERYRGVRGWLLFFCVGLTVLNPALFILALADVSQMPSWTPKPIQYLMVITIIIGALMTLYSISAGLSLWKIEPGAVEYAKRYLRINLVATGIQAVLPFLFLGGERHAAAIAGALTVEGVKGFIIGLIGFAIWNTYLNRSKRIKATYGGL